MGIDLRKNQELERAQKIKQVLEIMLDVYCHPDDHFDVRTTGMCLTLIDLCQKNLVSTTKRMLVQNYIDNHIPAKFSSWSRFVHVFFGTNPQFFFKLGDREPRIKWLKYHISKLQVLIDVLNH